MVRIYDSYEDEPRDKFLPLDTQLYATFYEHEMADFTEDLSFYSRYLKKSSCHLELGVGTGRLAEHLGKQGYKSVGIDISLPLLKIASRKKIPVICMDIVNLSFNKKFTTILAPYNLFNLVKYKRSISQVLQQIENHLPGNGHLAAEVFILHPHSELRKKGKSFQFQIFDYKKGKLIKEIKRYYLPRQQLVNVQERYRLRPQKGNKQDYINEYDIAAFSHSQWLELFTAGNLTVVEQFGDYDLTPVTQKTGRLLIALQKKS